MCGIAGFWQRKPADENHVEILNKMGAALAHRGPDDAGRFHDPTTGIGLAFRRLSIIDLSREGHQPMFSSSGRYVILFNGEVYNFQEIRAELSASQWRGHSDTEVMLEAIEQWGLDQALRRFVGMFAFALWDRCESKLFLVRDRLGIKPLYYGRVGSDFVFASELKAIRQYPGFADEIDSDVLALYLRYNYVPSPMCIFKDLRKLAPGHILTLSRASGEPELHPFWSAHHAARAGLQSTFQGSDVEVKNQLERKLLSAVRLRMVADVPVGVFLSGGVDSSTVASLMQAQSSRRVKTFTIGFHEDEYNEACYARKVAAHLGTDHTELYLTPEDALDVVPLLPSMYDEPFSDSSQIPTFLISKLARTSVTVCLSGDGGDEVFGGYTRYLMAPALWSTIRRVPRLARTTMAGMLQAVNPTIVERAFRALNPLLPARLRLSSSGDKAQALTRYLTVSSREDVYMRALSHWQEPSSVVLNSREPRAVFEEISSIADIAGLEEIMMLTDLVNYLPDDILTKVDRASMAVSLEARIPLLDHRVVEFAWMLPLHFKIRGNTGKWILRQVLSRYVPDQLINRPKMGFGVPIGRWLRGPLREWAEELLSETNLRGHGLFEVEPIRRKWKEHLSGQHNWQYWLWDVLVFQDWLAHVRRSTRVSQALT